MGSFEDAIKAEGKLVDTFNKDSKHSLGMIATEQFSDYCFLNSKNRYVFDSFDVFLEYVNKNYGNFVIDDEELSNVASKLKEMHDCKLREIYNEESGDDLRFLDGFKLVLQKALYAKCLIVAYFECGITKKCSVEDAIEILNILRNDGFVKLDEDDINKQIKKSHLEDRKGSAEIKVSIKGVPSDNRLKFLDKGMAECYKTELVFIGEDSVCQKFAYELKENSKDEQIVVTVESNVVKVKYIPKSETISDIDSKFSFGYDKPTDRYIIKDIEENGMKTFSAIYDSFVENMGVYKSNAGALYSGVIPRLNKVTYREPSLDNQTVEGFKLHLGRTSYFTMRSMGETDVKNHPFMNVEVDFGAYRGTFWDIISAIDEYEILVQNEYYEEMEKVDDDYSNGKGEYSDVLGTEKSKEKRKIEKDIEILNEYLKYSIAQHNINISGNLITEDGVCLYTLRGGNIEDSGDYYCSANGGSEIYDKSVDFYRNSVEEDIPSIRYGNENVYFDRNSQEKL